MGTQVDEAYKLLNKVRGNSKEKGNAGEDIALAIAKKFQQKVDCAIFHSYSYPYQIMKSGRPYQGNLFWVNGKYEHKTDASYPDEIDILVVTDLRIFAIEVKARTGKWTIDDEWVSQNNKKDEKSVVIQAEKHARHFYHFINELLPEGVENYIVPVIVFVDKAKIIDRRTYEFKENVNVVIANTLLEWLFENNSPLAYKLNKPRIIRYLKEHCTKYDRLYL